MNFDDVMNYYPNHNRATFNKIVAAQKSGSLIPFVGAGMSVFCGYERWGDVLLRLAEFILTEDKRKAVLAQINDGAYEEAAQGILDAYPAMLDQLPDLISPNKINGCPQEKIQTSAAFTLPYLFQKGLIMTTNFDRVLETIYLRHNGKQLETVTPNQQDRLAQLRQNQSLGLFKLHGDIGDDTVSIDDLVFTGDQYTEKYADGSPLVQELPRWFENHQLLFLGCSLNEDRTMEVLKRVTKDQRGIRHYAVLSCKKDNIPKRLKELHDLGILPVFYERGNHGAVRVILERLLEETNRESFKKLRDISWAGSAAPKEEHRLLFDAEYFPFTGREKELESLEAFCGSDPCVSWWVVTGPGGMGKSRLVYEFTNKKRKQGWRIKRFEAHPSKDSHATSLETLDEWLPEAPRTIIVLDDVQAHMEQVRRWLNETVRCPRSEKLRILLLEREGKDLNSSSWLGAESGSDIPDEWCHDNHFLCLEPMTNADLITIMDDYAAAAGKKLNAKLLLKTLERVDPELKRPLYAVAIADACCQGKDPTSWDRKQVLDTLLKRELDFHMNRLQGMTGKNATKTLRSELKELLARSCVCGFLFLDDIELERYPKLQKKIEDSDMDLQEFLEGLGILRTVSRRSIAPDSSGNSVGGPSNVERRKVIALSCPDLIKEHLVLNLAFENGKRHLLFPQDWEQNPRQLFFLGQLFSDYSDRLKEHPDFWTIFFQAAPQDVFSASIYGHILWGYTAMYPHDKRKAVDRLVQLYDEMNHAPEIAVSYAHGLVNLTVDQDLKERTETITQLDALYQNHSGIPEIAVAYAHGLVNLVVDQDLKGITETVARLDKLYQSHSDWEAIATYFTGCLTNLSFHQESEADVRDTITRSRAVLDRNIQNTSIQLHYAMTWFNLTLQQHETDIPATVSDIATFLRSNTDIIPQFKEALNEYLSSHPDHTVRYQPLLCL